MSVCSEMARGGLFYEVPIIVWTHNSQYDAKTIKLTAWIVLHGEKRGSISNLNVYTKLQVAEKLTLNALGEMTIVMLENVFTCLYTHTQESHDVIYYNYRARCSFPRTNLKIKWTEMMYKGISRVCSITHMKYIG